MTFDNETTPEAAGSVQMAEIDLRRYEARLGVWKVVLGTFIVGLAGIIIPAAINVTTLLFEDRRAKARFELERQTAHQQYIKDFYDTAVNQDVELRIRFANYFANLSEGEQRVLWQTYLGQLVTDRNVNRQKINDMEAQLVVLQNVEQSVDNVRKLDLIARELNWTYAELGYVPLDRSTVQVVPGKKERLYQETIDVIGRLISGPEPFDKLGEDYKRFWELYKVDLIGVESTAVERKMVAFGKELRRQADDADGLMSPRLLSLGQAVAVEMRFEMNIID